MPRAAVVTLVPARYGSYEPSTARWRIGARPAGFANTAPASPTSATPAPPNPAERVEPGRAASALPSDCAARLRSEEHTSELQSHSDLVCRLLLEKKKTSPARGRSARARPDTGPRGA